MDKMFSRFRSLSGSKLKSPTSASPPQSAATPSKEDILSTLEGFGEKIQDPVSREDNNNVHVRRNSSNSVNSEGYMEVTTAETEPTITSITHSYSLEWEKLFTKQGYLRHLRNYAIKGNLRSSRFRSIAWKLFLGVLPEESAAWVGKTKQMRQKYKELKDKLIVNPRKAVDTVDLSFNNPLSQEDESPWNRFFLDNELRLTIKQDVIRTFPEIQFYHSQEVREMMINVLFCYSREHSTLSYRQGMHELLAPMIFVLHCDHQAFLHASEMESLDDLVFNSSGTGRIILLCDPDRTRPQELNTRSWNNILCERIKYVLDPKYLEHDAYAMFAQVMQTVEPWYVSKEVYPTKPNTEPGSTQPFARPQDLNPSNVIVTKLTRIQDYLLKKADHELHLHLERHEIAPQIYGIRWIRLLFGREFPMQDLLVLWDAIFADGIGFDLVDYIFVAMLLYLRDHLLSSDYPSCLIILMKYPPVGDIHFFIDKARHLRDPHQYPRPPNYTYQSAQTAERSRQMEAKAPSGSRTQANASTLQSLTRKLYSSSRPKTLTVSGRKKMSKSSSEPMNLQTDISPVSPTPGTVPQHKRGSSASLSQVEDSMFRSAQSASSLGRLETQSLRSAVSTPDDASIADSPTRYSTLPARGKAARGRKHVVEPNPLEAELSSVRGQLNDKESMCTYCASKLDHHIERLQSELLHQSLLNEDEILLSLAGIKQVRDVLKGTLRWSQNLLDEDEAISINYNHYKMDVSESESPSTDSSPDVPEPHSSKTGFGSRKAAEKRLFYVSSEENSETVESPSETASNVVSAKIHTNMSFKLPLKSEVELEDLKTGIGAKNSGMRNGHGYSKGGYKRVNGPNDCESEFSKSWSPESSKTPEMSPDSEMEESPNPLYKIRHSSYDT